MLPTCKSYHCAEKAGLLELLESQRAESPAGQADHQRQSTDRLLHQLRGMGVLHPCAARAFLAPVDLAADLLEDHGRGEAAEQLRDGKVWSFLAGERCQRHHDALMRLGAGDARQCMLCEHTSTNTCGSRSMLDL